MIMGTCALMNRKWEDLMVYFFPRTSQQVHPAPVVLDQMDQDYKRLNLTQAKDKQPADRKKLEDEVVIF